MEGNGWVIIGCCLIAAGILTAIAGRLLLQRRRNEVETYLRETYGRADEGGSK